MAQGHARLTVSELLYNNKGVTMVSQNIENKIRKHDRYQRYNQIIWQFTGAQRH